MKILAIESSSEAVSVALMVDDECLCRHEVAPRKHAELLLPYMDELLDQAGLSLKQLDALAFGCGPGAFTGIRIATGVIQGVAYAADLPVVPVSTLACLAQGAKREGGKDKVIAAIDARMDEIYWGAFVADDDGLMSPVNKEYVIAPDHAPDVEGPGWFGTGSGWATYKTILPPHYGVKLLGFDGNRLPNAIDIASLAKRDFTSGLAVSAELAQPIYLRNKVAEKKKV
ncbi:MAG: tRNA (adenosine(37)-N6)-threonylcarbamoyltransferase complex dimerization subunit type 1 TsaB [Gammaproteobacteria bacterium]|nr:tRNA (adenosine(37)-N6)-threonylcarbamoyltransferase complex dimerization subunit type 1 TsaB [Gammaproteobacteria bacterium]